MNDSYGDIVLDFRFSEIEHELYAIEQHRLSLEAQLPTLLEVARERMRQEVLNESAEEDEEVRWSMEGSVDTFVENDLPRFFRYPVLVSLWAVYESATREVAKELQKAAGHPLQLDDIRGNVLERTKKYFEHVVKFPLTTDERALRDLEFLRVLRNAIAHGNGRRDAISPNTWKAIESWNQSGIFTDQEYLAFSAEFIQEMVATVNNTLSDLIQRVKKTHSV